VDRSVHLSIRYRYVVSNREELWNFRMAVVPPFSVSSSLNGVVVPAGCHPSMCLKALRKTMKYQPGQPISAADTCLILPTYK
jgi:hypothetical protein